MVKKRFINVAEDYSKKSNFSLNLLLSPIEKGVPFKKKPLKDKHLINFHKNLSTIIYNPDEK